MATRQNITGGSKAGKRHSGMGVDELKLVNNLYSVVNSSTYISNASVISDKGASGRYLESEAPHKLVSRPVSPI